MSPFIHRFGGAALFVTIMVGVGVVPRCSGCGGPSIRPLETYAEMNEACTAPNPPAVKEAWIKEAQAIIEKFEDVDSKDTINIDEVLPIYREKGSKGVKALKKKFVNFPLMENTTLSIDKAIPVMERYKKDGVNLAQEVVVDTGLKGTCDFPIYLPKHFWEMIQDAAKEAGVKDIRIAWGLRDSNLQAIMFVRSVKSACDKYPSNASPGCMKKVSKGVAGKPKKAGFTHFFSADIDNWQAMKKELLDRGFAVGCSGVGEKDKRHTTWGLNQRDASLKCTISEWWHIF